MNRQREMTFKNKFFLFLINQLASWLKMQGRRCSALVMLRGTPDNAADSAKSPTGLQD